MGKRTLLTLTLSSLLLFSCSTKSGSSDDYYRVDFYTDYAGIVYDDSLSTESATLAGHCFVRKNASTHAAKIASIEKDASNQPIDYKTSRQNPVTGHQWVFDSWAGFYSDGTAIDIDNITSSCAVFAHFESKPNDCNVKFAARGKTYLNAVFPYGSSLLDTFSLSGASYIDASGNAIPVSPSYDPEGKGLIPYYENWSFEGWTCTPKDADGNGEMEKEGGVAKLYSTEEAMSRVIESDLMFSADSENGFQKTDSVYTVTLQGGAGIEYKDASSNVLDPSLGLTAKVSYGKAVDLSSAFYQGTPIAASVAKESTPQYAYSLVGWTGTYGNGDEVPVSIRGKEVDWEHILFDCELIPSFRSSVQTYDVSFYEADGTTLIEKQTIAYGASASIPTPSTRAGETFSGLWQTLDGTETLDSSDFSSISQTRSVKAVYASTELAHSATVLGSDGNPYVASFRYHFSPSAKGYSLWNIDLPASLDKDEVSVSLRFSDFADDATFPELFPLREIHSFNQGIEGGEAEGDQFGVSSILFSDGSSDDNPFQTVLSISTSAFSGMNRLANLDLSGLSVETFESRCFASMLSLVSVSLPSSMKSIGSYAFFDTKAETVTVHGYADEASASSSIRFGDHWNYVSATSSASVVYSL